MLTVVSFMREYPLLNVEWDLNRSARSYWPIRIGHSDRSDVSDEDDETEDEESDQEEPEDAQSEDAQSKQARSEEVQPEDADSEEEDSEAAEEIRIPPRSALVSFSADDIDIAAPLSLLRELDHETYAKLAFVELSLYVRPPQPDRNSAGLSTNFDITLMANCTEQDFEDFGLGTECGGIRVRFQIAHEPESEYNVSESEEDE